MEARPKILLLDDDPDLLALYKETLSQLPSQPEIHTATSGNRALALLEAEPFRLFISDLKMPKMDGLQVLSIVRRKHPGLRTVVLTSVMDEQFRTRVYALGVDLFWQKPGTEREIKMFLECVESLLERENETGFRGVQSKSLVDIVQLECLSQNSTVLRITNGPLSGKIWIHEGELVDAQAEDLQGEEAFRTILQWKTGNFEVLPAEPSRPRAIMKSYNALLLESAQAIDESRGQQATETKEEGALRMQSRLSPMADVEGVEFVLALEPDETTMESHGVENPEQMAQWARLSLSDFRSLGDRLHAGPLEDIEGLGAQRNVALARQRETDFCVGWQHSMEPVVIQQMMRKILAIWAS